MIRHIVAPGVGTMPVERYIRRAWPMLPASAVKALFKRRDVKLCGARCAPDDLVHGGDDLMLFLPNALLPEAPAFAFDDGRLAVLIKPHGLPVDVDSDGIGADTLLTRLRLKYPDAKLCNRLDAATGGLTVAAMDDLVCAQALETFKAHSIQKTYLALAKGGFERREGTLRAWLVKDAQRAQVRVVHRDQRGARAIETKYRVLTEQQGVARVELEPVTGRTHQLRAHMADFGHPLLGDDKYGDRALNRTQPGGLKLWCARLRILPDAPLTDYRNLQITSDPPKWWNESALEDTP